MIRFSARAAVAALSLIALATPAFAHATLEVQEAKIGASYKAVLRVPHGCGTEATHTVRIQIPEGFYNAKPMPKAGWTLETVTGPYAQGYENHGTTLTEGVKEIVWSGGNLPNEWYDEFVFRGTFAATLEPGDFVFPTIQECANGTEAWLDQPGGSHPAPSVRLVVVPSGHDEHAGHAMGPASGPAPGVDAAAVSLGSIEITAPFTRATLPNAPVAGGFLTLTNTGTEDDRLVSVTSPISKETQIHEMAMDGDVMKMRQLVDGLPIPAGQRVELAPGGYHLMFLGLTGPVVEGSMVPVTLTFEKAGEITIELPAAGTAADAPATGHH